MRGQTPTPKGTQVFIGTEPHGPHPWTRTPTPLLSPCSCTEPHPSPLARAVPGAPLFQEAFSGLRTLGCLPPSFELLSLACDVRIGGVPTAQLWPAVVHRRQLALPKGLVSGHPVPSHRCGLWASGVLRLWATQLLLGAGLRAVAPDHP